VCHKTSILSQFDGTITPCMPIQEIYEIRHEINTPRVLIGEKMIALLGNLTVKAYCVKKENKEMFLVEKSFTYRNYITGNYNFHHLKPCTSLRSKVQDIIIESVKDDEIRLSGIILTDLVFSLEKEYDTALLGGHKEDRQEYSVETKELSYQSVQSEEDSPLSEYKLAEEATKEEEVYAEVIQGSNQDLTIILE
jgi:hypothetical protein